MIGLPGHDGQLITPSAPQYAVHFNPIFVHIDTPCATHAMSFELTRVFWHDSSEPLQVLPGMHGHPRVPGAQVLCTQRQSAADVGEVSQSKSDTQRLSAHTQPGVPGSH